MPHNRFILRLFHLAVLFIFLFHCSRVARQDVPSVITALDILNDPPKVTNTTHPPRILLVSAFFPLPNVKHSASEYNEWLSNFLGPISTPIYFYTQPAFAQTVHRLRGAAPLTLDTSLDTPFNVPPLLGREAQYAAMHQIDRERRIHTPALYAVWNAKPWLLENAVRAARAAGDEYDYAFWCDAGSFRSGHSYRAWPDPSRVEALFEDDTQLFIPLAAPPPRRGRFWTPADGPFDADVTEGSFFGGASPAIGSFPSSFYTFHDYHARRGAFVGKDQTLINALLFAHPSRFRTVLFGDSNTDVGTVWGLDHKNFGACGSEWFYYQFFLASKAERGIMREMWVQWEAAQSWWGAWEWWKARQSCRLSRVVGVREVLETAFGSDWVPPIGSGAI